MLEEAQEAGAVEQVEAEELKTFTANLSKKLTRGVTNWILRKDEGPRNHNSYVRMLHRELARDLHGYLTENVAERLRARGITPISSEKASITVKKVLLNTKDLHHRLLTAPDPTSVGVLAGGWSLGALLDNQDNVVESLTQAAQDDYEQDSFNDTLSDDMADVDVPDFDPDNPPDNFTGFTGNRMWNVNSDNSRHPELDGMVVGPDDNFPIGDDKDGWFGPREDPSDAANSSNCQCSLSYERINGDGESEWV